jgi:hypothetical protein
MRTVSIIPPGAGAVVIFDGNKTPLPDACEGGFRPKRLREFQTSLLFRSAYRKMFDRFNLAVQWDFTVTHSFTSIMACQDFMGNRAAVLPGNGELMILTASSQGIFSRYYKCAFLTNVECADDIGQTCKFRYSLVFTMPYSTTP